MLWSYENTFCAHFFFSLSLSAAIHIPQHMHSSGCKQGSACSTSAAPHACIVVLSWIPLVVALIVVVPLLSMEGQKALGFHQKYLNLCSEDERRSCGFETAWGWVLNDRIFIFGWTILLKFNSICSKSYFVKYPLYLMIVYFSSVL